MWIRHAVIFAFLPSFPAYAEPLVDRQCSIRTLEGIEAQEMMVKGVIMHSEFEGTTNEVSGGRKISFIHTLRADWTIWICLQTLSLSEGSPPSLELVCPGCNYD